MDFNSIIDLLSALPTWAWVLAAFAMLFALGDRGLWDYEAKFPSAKGVGRGEVELECYKKRGAHVELHLELEPDYRDAEVEVFFRGTCILHAAEQKRERERLYFREPLSVGEPREGELVSVRLNRREVFSGPLIKD
ncbi:MAG: hypothetical protein AAF384_14830 [Pseudomonadota bacterium]